MGGTVRGASALLVAWLCAAPMVAAAAEPSHDEDGGQDRSSLLDMLSSPLFGSSDPIRIQSEMLVVPDASVGSGHVGLVRPEVGIRATGPASDRVVLRVMTRAAVSRYDFRGDVWGPAVLPPLGVVPNAEALVGETLDLYSARIAFEGAYRLSDSTGWFADGEQWGLVSAANIGSRWEDSDFHDGASAGFAVGIGYEIPDVLRLALGASLQSPLVHGDFDVSPFVSLRWRPVDRVTIRSRELGVQVEFDVSPQFESYLTGFRSSDRFGLSERFGALDDLSFRDRYIRAGAGFVWKFTPRVRLGLEGGAVVDRSLRISDQDLGTLISRRPGAAGYFSVRLELRI